MNLLLVDTDEVVDGRARIRGRRAEHVHGVLRKREGDGLRVGVIGHAPRDARVLSSSAGTLDLELNPGPPIAPPRVTLLLAMPRPKGLSRILQMAASFGVARIFLLSAWRVEKAYLSSPRLKPDRLREDVWLGCEQGRQTWLPEVTVCPRFRPFVEDELPDLMGSRADKVVLQPGSNHWLDTALRTTEEDVFVAIGPEGGWISRELETFDDQGFVRTTLGAMPLRTEAAVPACLAQLALVEAQRRAATA